MPTPSPLPLDAAGLLPDGSVPFPARAEAYTVFAQQKDARLDEATWARHAKQFFQAELRLSRPKLYGDRAPPTDAAHVSLTSRGAPPCLCTVYARPATPVDQESAEEAERAAGGGGLSLLARRCPVVFLVALGSRDERAPLELAAIIASVVLGPILAPERPEIFGVRTARAKLEALARPGSA